MLRPSGEMPRAGAPLSGCSLSTGHADDLDLLANE